MVLCGGESRRMGEDKWKLRIYGQTWANYVATLLKPHCETVFISSVKKLELDFPFVIDEFPGEGPLGAWYSFSKKFPGRNLISLPVDMPLLTTDDVACLRGEESGYLAGPEEKAPLAAFISADDLLLLAEKFEAGLRSAFEFWGICAHQIRYISSDRPLKNLNAPKDLPNKR